MKGENRMPGMPKNLVWLDLEMTGLDPDSDVIIEIATIVTDTDLNHVADGPVLAVGCSKERMEAMGEWCQTHHTASGLLARVLESSVTTQEAEAATLAFLDQHVEAGTSPMCGNSIGQDRRFLYRQMPKLEAFFHYRNIDVSSIKELARYWKPELMNRVKKQNKHLALDDIRDSISELQVYKEHFFKLL